MVIKNDYYEFYRNTSGYYVRAVQTGSLIAVTLNKVINNSNVQVEIYSVGETATLLVLPEEAIYNVVIVYDVSGVETTDTYDIKYFPTLKADIIDNLKDVICNCSETGVTLPCSQSVLHPTVQKVYNSQLILNSIFIYRHLMLPIEFLRVMDCCISSMFGEFSEILINGITNQYAAISIRGVPSADDGTYRKVIALMYLVLYHSEIAVSEYTAVTTGTEEVNDEITGIQTTFGIGTIEDCYTLLGMDFNSLYNTFAACYQNKSLISCTEVIIIEAAVSHLRYNSYTSIYEIGSTLNITLFTWDVLGQPQNLKLNDTEGVLIDEPVFGDQHAGGFPYAITTPKLVTWTLSGDNVDSITVATRWVRAHYYGSNETGDVPIASEILAGTKVVSDIRTEVSVDIQTTNKDYGWIAVSHDDGTANFNRWKVIDPANANNEGNIGLGEFINAVASVVVNGVPYVIYQYSWSTEVTWPLKLFRL